jgi:uncharacterized protein YegL
MHDDPAREPESPTDETAFTDACFVENPEPRCPCVLVLDTTAVLEPRALAELNAALEQFREELLSDELASKRVEVAVVTYPPSRTAAPFSLPEDFAAPELRPDVSGEQATLVDALELAIGLVSERKEAYKRGGVQYYRPLVFLVTTGGALDFEAASDLVRDGESGGAFVFQAVGVQGANMRRLELLSTREPVVLESLRFRELFRWLGRSLQVVSRSHVENEVELPAWPAAA